MSTSAKLLNEVVGEDGVYVGTFLAYGLEFTITHRGGAYIPQASVGNPKRANWWVEAAVRLCQSAAHARVTALRKEDR